MITVELGTKQGSACDIMLFPNEVLATRIISFFSKSSHRKASVCPGRGTYPYRTSIASPITSFCCSTDECSDSFLRWHSLDEQCPPAHVHSNRDECVFWTAWRLSCNTKPKLRVACGENMADWSRLTKTKKIMKVYCNCRGFFFSNSKQRKTPVKEQRISDNRLIKWNKNFNIGSNVSSDNKNNYLSLTRVHMQWETCLKMEFFWP